MTITLHGAGRARLPPPRLRYTAAPLQRCRAFHPYRRRSPLLPAASHCLAYTALLTSVSVEEGVKVLAWRNLSTYYRCIHCKSA
jgi:hypothetical protein